MPVATAQETVNRFCAEVINAHDPAAAKGLVADDFAELDPLPGQGTGRVGLQDWLAGWFAAFPDLTWTNDEQIVDGDRVVTRFHWTGTQEHEFMGIPATHRTITVNGVVIDRVSDGLMVDSRMLMNALSMFQQLGESPSNVGG
jgi:steroid delta-isomerase-like uncharacterized protein